MTFYTVLQCHLYTFSVNKGSTSNENISLFLKLRNKIVKWNPGG